MSLCASTRPVNISHPTTTTRFDCCANKDHFFFPVNHWFSYSPCRQWTRLFSCHCLSMHLEEGAPLYYCKGIVWLAVQPNEDSRYIPRCSTFYLIFTREKEAHYLSKSKWHFLLDSLNVDLEWRKNKDPIPASGLQTLCGGTRGFMFLSHPNPGNLPSWGVGWGEEK